MRSGGRAFYIYIYISVSALLVGVTAPARPRPKASDKFVAPEISPRERKLVVATHVCMICTLSTYTLSGPSGNANANANANANPNCYIYRLNACTQRVPGRDKCRVSVNNSTPSALISA